MNLLLVVVLFEGITIIVGLAVISTRLETIAKLTKKSNDQLSEITNLLRK